MKILIIGSGSREHAIAYQLTHSDLVKKIVVCPGNLGMLTNVPNLHLKNISVTDIEGLLNFAINEKFDLTIVGPESSLSLGIVDLFKQNNLSIVGPSKLASQLETSKAFGKKIMAEANVPTAAYHEFFSLNDALMFLETTAQEKMVVKCDGLAAGKGVIVCLSKSETINAVNSLMSEKLLGENVEHIIIEEMLVGDEISAFALCDGNSFTFLGTACDHKRLRDNDLGPNTGGMGAYSPATGFSTTDHTDQLWIEENVFLPMIQTMKNKDIPFSGILFAGLMKTPDRGFQVLEFNVRFGDPETQVLLPLIDEDLLPWLMASAHGKILDYQKQSGSISPLRKNMSGVHVVMAAHGYPGTEGTKIRSGDSIFIDSNLETNENNFLFFAGVEKLNDSFVTKGGRVLGVTSMAETLKDARIEVYKKIEAIHFEGAQYRSDIGAKAIVTNGY